MSQVLVNARTNRVIEVAPVQPGREAALDRHHPGRVIGGEAWALSMSNLYFDVPNHLWRIHDEWYDLEKYLDTHPGGRLFLEQTRGTDCTESFEAHHVREINPRLLQQYRVSKTGGTQTPQRFSFDQSFTPIKQFVAKYLATKLNNPTGSTPMWAGVLYSAVVLQFVLAFRVAVKRNSLVLAAVAGFLLTGVWGVGHNQIHRARNWKTNPWGVLRYALEFTGFSTEHQTITHALSHHQNVNTNYDVEIYETNDIGLQWLTSDAVNSSRLFRIPGFFAVVASQLSIGAMVQRVVGRSLKLDWLNTDLLIPASMVAFACKENGWRRGLLLCWTMWSTFGAWFIPSSLSLHHSADEHTGAPLCYHEGEPEGFERDFARHQIQSTRDHSPLLNHYLALVLFAHLNCHTVHHIFPTIDRAHHEELLQALLDNNVGGFRDVYYARPQNNQGFLPLYLGIFKMCVDRRYEVV